MRQALTALILLCGGLALTGCGQTGPLYLPEEEAQEAPAEAPQQGEPAEEESTGQAASEPS